MLLHTLNVIDDVISNLVIIVILGGSINLNYLDQHSAKIKEARPNTYLRDL